MRTLNRRNALTICVRLIFPMRQFGLHRSDHLTQYSNHLTRYPKEFPMSKIAITSPELTPPVGPRSEEHTSELQSPCNLVCRLLLEKTNGRGSARRLRGYRQITARRPAAG